MSSGNILSLFCPGRTLSSDFSLTSQRLSDDDLSTALFDQFFLPAAVVHPPVAAQALELLVHAGPTMQSTLLGRFSRALCVSDISTGAEHAAVCARLAELVPDSAAKRALEERANIAIGRGAEVIEIGEEKIVDDGGGGDAMADEQEADAYVLEDGQAMDGTGPEHGTGAGTAEMENDV